MSSIFDIIFFVLSAHGYFVTIKGQKDIKRLNTDINKIEELIKNRFSTIDDIYNTLSKMTNILHHISKEMDLDYDKIEVNNPSLINKFIKDPSSMVNKVIAFEEIDPETINNDKTILIWQDEQSNKLLAGEIEKLRIPDLEFLTGRDKEIFSDKDKKILNFFTKIEVKKKSSDVFKAKIINK